MKELTTSQCKFCTKTSVNKDSIRLYDSDCYFHPSTRSCGTCLWFSQKYVAGLPKCYLGESYESVKKFETLTRTKCNRWINIEVVDEIDVFYNERGILDHLLAGDLEVLNIIAGITANGVSYYNESSGCNNQ